VTVSSLFPHAHDLLRIRIRKRAQQDGVHNGIDGRGRADAERQSDDADGGEARIAGQGANGIAQDMNGNWTRMVGRSSDGEAGWWSLA